MQHVEGEMIEFRPENFGPEPRPGLRADCLKDPKKVWHAALAYTFANGRHGEDRSRKWAYGIWSGVYPNSKLPRGWFDLPPVSIPDAQAFSLVEREVKRFRKRRAA